MIKIVQRGNFSKLKDFLTRSRRKARIGELAEQFADACVEELKKVTPKDSGLTAESWDYELEVTNKMTTITFINRNIQNGMNVALLIEFGHGTPSGVWVEGREYIDPVIQKRYLQVIDNKWKELTKL